MAVKQGEVMMYRILVAVLTSLFFSFNAQAGNVSNEYLSHNLDLDEVQRKKLDNVMSEQHKTHKKLRRQGKVSCDAKRKMWSETRVRLNNILNADQLNTYDKLQKNRQRRCAPTASSQAMS